MLKLGRGYWRWWKGVPWCHLVYVLLSPRHNQSWGKEPWNRGLAFTQQLLQPGFWGLLYMNPQTPELYWSYCTFKKLIFFSKVSLLAFPELLFRLVTLGKISVKPTRKRKKPQLELFFIAHEMCLAGLSVNLLTLVSVDTLISWNSEEKLTTKEPHQQSFLALCNEVAAGLCISELLECKIHPQCTLQQHPERIASPPSPVKQHRLES